MQPDRLTQGKQTLTLYWGVRNDHTHTHTENTIAIYFISPLLFPWGKIINAHRKNISRSLFVLVCSCIIQLILFMLNIYIYKIYILFKETEWYEKGNLPSALFLKIKRSIEVARAVTECLTYFPHKVSEMCLLGWWAASNLPGEKHGLRRMGTPCICFSKAPSTAVP